MDYKTEQIYKMHMLILKLQETLQFYANPDNYQLHSTPDGMGGDWPIILDFGQRARDILKERL